MTDKSKEFEEIDEESLVDDAKNLKNEKDGEDNDQRYIDQVTEEISQDLQETDIENLKSVKDDEDKKDDDDDEDNDQRYIDQMLEEINQDLQETKENLEGILPESNQQRNLDREVGGLESELMPKQEKVVEDEWDDRGEEIQEMNEDAYEDLIDASTSSLRQSFIGTKKRQKKQAKKNAEAAKDSFEEMSHVQRLKNLREDKSTATSKGDRGRW